MTPNARMARMFAVDGAFLGFAATLATLISKGVANSEREDLLLFFG
jgi:hypothetical protein